MATPNKTDYLGFGSIQGLTVVGATENKTASAKTAQGQDGSIVASEVYGEAIDPSNDYKVGSTATINVKIGNVTTADSKKIMLESVSVNTAAGSYPTISASGKEVESGATTGDTYDSGEAEIKGTKKAQILFNAFSLSGSGCHLNSANYTISGDVTPTEADGARIASDPTAGVIQVAIEIVQVGTTAPTLTAGDGWAITAPLTQSYGEGDYPKYSATLTKYLTRTTASV